jgi:putative cardiolipin synthase
MRVIRSLRERGVGLTLVTNSLAAIDVPLAFAGYLRYRTPMLRLGVDIYEVTPGRVAESHRFRVFGSSSGRLHAKAVVIDRRIAVIGSMNLDPRSDSDNTETALLIDSPELARQLLTLVEFVERYAAYQVRLTENGATVWSNPDPQDSDPSRFSEEPETSLWERSLIRLLEPVVPESLL